MKKTCMYFVAQLALVAFLAGGCGDDDGSAVDAAPPADADPTPRALFEDCTDSTQCESGLCYTYGMGAMLCTKECSGNDECPAPSPGCNMMGICRRP